uniref:E1 domain-containing protein n=1 Tax=Anopheles culicifacies TaxID=139723 RepID=A0A182MUM8_9DIPT
MIAFPRIMSASLPGAISATSQGRRVTRTCMCDTCRAASPRWEPQISVLCEAGQTYHPQFLSEEGRWTTDLSIKVPGSTCLRDKMDLLDYCKKLSGAANGCWIFSWIVLKKRSILLFLHWESTVEELNSNGGELKNQKNLS